MGELLFQTSLVAAFIAGMVALFAPCCITFLLPAYLGNVFKEKEKVLFMTLIFGLGIFVVLLPAVLGMAFISKLIFRYHDLIYILGGFVMLVVAVISFFGIKLPMPNISGRDLGAKTDVLSVFTLGIFSGITSACCAPVLIGILALTFLSPSFFGALAIGGMYVLGMITPLLLISMFLEGRVSALIVLRKPLTTLNLFGKTYPLILNNLIASAVFFITGTLTLVLVSTGKLSSENMEGFTKFIQNTGGWVQAITGGNILIDVVFLMIVVIFLYIVVKKM